MWDLTAVNPEAPDRTNYGKVWVRFVDPSSVIRVYPFSKQWLSAPLKTKLDDESIW
jgi:hypothetical protein